MAWFEPRGGILCVEGDTQQLELDELELEMEDLEFLMTALSLFNVGNF